jgi:50S ribosomal subunit-associated GTPase HflX
MNKVDRLADRDFDSLGRRLIGEAREGHAAARAVAVSALTGDGIDRLLGAIDELLPFDPVVHASLDFSSAEAGAKLAMLHELGRVTETRYEGDRCLVEAEIPESVRRRLEQS